MSHGLTRLESRFQADPSDVETAKAKIGEALDAEIAEELGLVTFALDDIDWDDEVRVLRGARQLLAGQPHRHGGQSPLCRA
jgi:benzoyl-CoA-dihydrodiol lyase